MHYPELNSNMLMIAFVYIFFHFFFISLSFNTFHVYTPHAYTQVVLYSEKKFNFCYNPQQVIILFFFFFSHPYLLVNIKMQVLSSYIFCIYLIFFFSHCESTKKKKNEQRKKKNSRINFSR